MRLSSSLYAPLVAAALAAAAPRPAEACSALPCIDGYFYPSTGQTIPANAPSLLFRPGQIFPSTAPDVTFTGPSGDVPFAISEAPRAPGGYEIVPTTTLAPGLYTLRSDETCQEVASVRTSTFTISAPAMLPTTLGDLAGLDVRRGDLTIEASAQCSERVATVSVPLQLTLDAGAAPWAPLLLYRTLVDGQPWRPRSSAPEVLPLGGSWRGRGADQIYAHCEPLPPGTADYGLSEGDHTVVMEATLPGTAIVVQTPPLQVTLRCNPNGGIDGGTMTVDGHVPVDDASINLPPAVDAGAGGGLRDRPEGCRGVPAGDGAPLLGLLLLVGLARRRRT